jgi:hypothetical protein
VAFLKLFPREHADPLPIATIIARLEGEFPVVKTSKEDGQKHLSAVIAATERFSDELPGKQERLEYFRSVKEVAVFVEFGDRLDLLASCCLLSGAELLFSYPYEISGPGRPLIERAASALGYEVFEG